MDLINNEQHFTQDIITLIETSKQNLAISVNAELTLLYWHIGERIATHILQGERADYGKQVVQHLANDLTSKFGKGWSKRNLLQMIKFYQTFPIIKLCRHCLHN